ncbi:PLC-like phosphodiesterase [Flagelloscypha sp. PMI_526]|nr:PLC-like phosphodiesterase [Flagelloscypha sp. PMI_526]
MANPLNLPACFGHRGASARYPENTLASFEAAIRDGAEGIESGNPNRILLSYVHVSADNVVIMFHDPALDRTTDTTGLIRERSWHGENGMERAKTIKLPRQGIPTFAQTLDLLMKPENLHAQFNVDVKPQNDPARLFRLMHNIISSYDGWETHLAPRLVLGLWHPKFVPLAKEQLGYCRRSFLGNDLAVARKFFFKECDTFSVEFGALTTADGEKFRREIKDAGKKLMVWTVNEPKHLMECARWGVDVIITDHTQRWLEMRKELQELQANAALASKYSRAFLWTTLSFYTPIVLARAKRDTFDLKRCAGPFEAPIAVAVPTSA